MRNFVNDPIADLLTRIRNAGNARKDTVDIPYSRIKEDICKILSEQGFVGGVEKVEKAGERPVIRVGIKYSRDRRQTVIQGIERISKPSRRSYSDVASLPRVKNGLGIAILSTSRGIMTESRARTENVGGELLCRVW